MLKAADTLAEAGYQVRMVSARYMDWAWRADQDLRRTRNWKWTVVNYDRASARPRYLQSSIRFRSAQMFVRRLGPKRCPFSVVTRAYSRVHDDLVTAILCEPSDFIYGGTSGALAAVAEAASRSGVPFGLDLEDFHSSEQREDAEGRVSNQLAERIERMVLPKALVLTAAGTVMSTAYAEKYGLVPIPVGNVHPLPSTEPDISPSSGPTLRLYWFGQTVGPDKGLETLIRAVSLFGIPAKLDVRGRAIAGALSSLRQLASNSASSLKIVHHEPAPPDTLVETCRGYDVGLSSFDTTSSYNCQLAAPNKPCIYILAGLAVAISDTPGQRPLGLDLGLGAIMHQLGDAETLGASLKRLSVDKSLLARAKAAAWEAAKRRWHWEHPNERGALLRAVAGVFQP